jgi:hypothetical protein
MTKEPSFSGARVLLHPRLCLASKPAGRCSLWIQMRPDLCRFPSCPEGLGYVVPAAWVHGPVPWESQLLSSALDSLRWARLYAKRFAVMVQNETHGHREAKDG